MSTDEVPTEIEERAQTVFGSKNMIVPNNNHVPSPLSIHSRIDKDAFARDICRLFSYEKGGHTERWMYHHIKRPQGLKTNSKLWEQFTSRAPNYYIPTEDRELIASGAQTLAKQFSDHKIDTIVDFGSGDDAAVKDKSAKFLQAFFQDSKEKGLYVPIDISEYLLDSAVTAVKEAAPYVDVAPIHGDFFRMTKVSKESYMPLPGENRLGMMLGSTITNLYMTEGSRLPRTLVIKKIKSLADQIAHPNGGGGLVFTFDSNPDLNHAASAYDDESWRLMLTGLMIDVSTLLKPNSTCKNKSGFDPFGWKYVSSISEDDRAIHHCVEATEEQHFSVTYWDKHKREELTKNYDIGPGQRFVILNTIKYTPQLFTEFLEAAGLEPHDIITHENGRMVMASASIPRNYEYSEGFTPDFN